MPRAVGSYQVPLRGSAVQSQRQAAGRGPGRGPGRGRVSCHADEIWFFKGRDNL
jgi:hypothetical protein